MRTTNGKIAFGLMALIVLSVFSVALPSGATGGRAADLTINTLVADDTTPGLGDNISITMTIQNVGQGNATDVAVTLSAKNGTDPNIFDWNWAYGSACTLPCTQTDISDAANATAGDDVLTITAWWDSTIVPTEADKIYTVTATASDAADGNASNGTQMVNVTWSGPMLNGTGFTTTPATSDEVFSDGNTTASATIANTGAGDAFSFDVSLWLTELDTEGNATGTPIEVDSWQDLQLNSSEDWETPVVQYNFSAADEGTEFAWGVTIDAGTATWDDTIISVVGRESDLGFTSAVTYTPANPLGTQTVSFEFTVANSASATRDASDVSVTVNVNEVDAANGTTGTPGDHGIFQGSADAPSDIAIGDEWTGWVNWTTVAADVGSWTWDAWVLEDADVAAFWIADDDITIGPVPAPKYEITSIVDPTPAVSDDVGDSQDVNVTVTVKNIGNAGGMPTVAIYDAADMVTILDSEAANVTLAPGASWEVNLTLTAVTAENDTLWLLNVTAGEAGNKVTAPTNFTIPGDKDEADVGIDSVAVLPATVEVGQGHFAITVAATNHGDANATDFAVEIWATPDTGANISAGTVTFDDLAPGASGSQSLNFTPTAGHVGGWTFWVMDGDATVAATKVTVTPALTASLTVNVTSGDIKGQVAAGAKKTAKVSVEVKNTGTGTVTDVNVTISDGTTTLASDTSIASLAPGESKTVELTVKVKPKKQTLTVAAVGKFRGNDITAGAAAGGSATVTNKVTETTPGFEGVVFVAAVVVALAILRRKRK